MVVEGGEVVDRQRLPQLTGGPAARPEIAAPGAAAGSVTEATENQEGAQS